LVQCVPQLAEAVGGEVADVDDPVHADPRLLVSGARVSVGQKRKRQPGFGVGEADLARGAAVAECPRSRCGGQKSVRQTVVAGQQNEQPHVAGHAGGSTAFAGDGQFLVSNGSIVGTSNFDAYGGSEADFSYRNNENNYIWYFDNHVIGLVNYANGTVLSMYGFASSIDKIATTTEGKYVISRGNNSLLLFGTGMF